MAKPLNCKVFKARLGAFQRVPLPLICSRLNPTKEPLVTMKPSKKIKALYLAGFFGLLDWS
jgi:hypothetical protein